MLAAQVTDLASLGQLGIAGRVFAADKGIQMGEGLGAVAVTWDRIGVDMIGCRQKGVSHHCELQPPGLRIAFYLLKGPPSLGRLLNRTLNQTPMPSGLAVAAMVPWTLPPLGKAALSKAESGRVAE
jgi:hypothetical protein